MAYNKILSENPDFKDLPSRENAIIGSTHPKAAMITVGATWNDNTTIEPDRTFIIIPFDNVKIAVAPVMDLIQLNKDRLKWKFDIKYFKNLKYTKNFHIDSIPNNIDKIPLTISNSKEIWTEVPALLLRYTSIERLKELTK